MYSLCPYRMIGFLWRVDRHNLSLVVFKGLLADSYLNYGGSWSIMAPSSSLRFGIPTLVSWFFFTSKLYLQLHPWGLHDPVFVAHQYVNRLVVPTQLLYRPIQLEWDQTLLQSADFGQGPSLTKENWTSEEMKAERWLYFIIIGKYTRVRI